MEEKGLRVNSGRTKVMKFDARFGLRGESDHVKFAGRQVVGSNSIKCNQCRHGRCSGASGKLQNVAGFQYKICVDGQLYQEIVKIMISSMDKLECIDKFCYLGDLRRGRRGIASKCTYSTGLPVLTSRGVSLKVKGKASRPEFRVSWDM